MATKVEKRSVRKEKNAEALGIDTTKTKKEEKKPVQGLSKEEKNKWFWFFVNVALLWFIFTFYQAS